MNDLHTDLRGGRKRVRPNWISNFLRPGVRQKMVLVLLCVLTVALGTTTWLTIEQQEDNVLRETQQHGKDVARIVSQALTFSIVGYDYHTIQLLLDEIVKSHDIGYAKVLSKKGNVMAESGEPRGSASNWTMFSRDIVFDRQIVGRVTIGLNNAGIISRLEAQKRSIVYREAIIIMLIMLGEFLALSYIIIRPVGIISRALDKSVDEYGKITRHIPLVSKDEFGRLAAQFNEMREQLNDANRGLQSKINLADAMLTENNYQLLEQTTELQRMNEELQRIAITDPLTGLYNRRYLKDVVEVDLALSLRHGEKNSILIIDIDHFKQVNDTYGHQTGDNVLIEIAHLLGKEIRGTDLACRMGGEEFVLLCRRVGKQESVRIGEKICRTIEAHPFMDTAQKRIAVTVSIGVVSFPDGTDTNSIEDYMQRADLALYRSKSTGRNKVTHHTDMGGSVTVGQPSPMDLLI